MMNHTNPTPNLNLSLNHNNLSTNLNNNLNQHNRAHGLSLSLSTQSASSSSLSPCRSFSSSPTNGLCLPLAGTGALLTPLGMMLNGTPLSGAPLLMGAPDMYNTQAGMAQTNFNFAPLIQPQQQQQHQQYQYQQQQQQRQQRDNCATLNLKQAKQMKHSRQSSQSSQSSHANGKTRSKGKGKGNGKDRANGGVNRFPAMAVPLAAPVPASLFPSQSPRNSRSPSPDTPSEASASSLPQSQQQRKSQHPQQQQAQQAHHYQHHQHHQHHREHGVHHGMQDMHPMHPMHGCSGPFGFSGSFGPCGAPSSSGKHHKQSRHKHLNGGRRKLSIVLLDWDDTLFPTTAMMHKKENVSADALTSFGRALYDMLSEYIRVFGQSNVYIVTNSTKQWTLKSLQMCSKMLQDKERRKQQQALSTASSAEEASPEPGCHDHDHHDHHDHDTASRDYFLAVHEMLVSLPLRIVSAQQLYSAQYPSNSTIWKIKAFKQLTIEHFKHVKGNHEGDGIIYEIVSIADSENEYVASFEAKYKLNKFVKRRKCRHNVIRLHRVKLAHQPSVRDITRQLHALIHEALPMHHERGSVTIRYQ